MTSDFKLDRRAAVAHLLRDRQDLIVATGLGSPTYDVAAAGDHPRNFYLWGAMGGAAMLGLGIARAQPQLPVAVFTGDGEMLMGLGSFATIGMIAPPNLRIIVLDNGQYGETGGQASHTGAKTDLAAVARACGLAGTRIDDELQVSALASRLHDAKAGAEVAVLRISPEEHTRVLPSRDAVLLKLRLREALGLSAGH